MEKGHLSVLNLTMSVAVISISLVLIALISKKVEIPSEILIIFSFLVMLSHLINFFQHGFKPVGTTSMFVAIFVSILLIRSVVDFVPFKREIFKNLSFFISLFLFLEILKLSHL